MPKHTCSHPGCSYTTSIKGSLTTHMRTHTGERPYACSFAGCSFRATTSSNLSAHTLKHSDARPHACAEPGCTYAAKSRPELGAHARAQHKEGALRRCAWPGCGYLAGSARVLREHVHGHLGQRPYSCAKCGTFASAFAGHLHRHKKACRGAGDPVGGAEERGTQAAAAPAAGAGQALGISGGCELADIETALGKPCEL